MNTEQKAIYDGFVKFATEKWGEAQVNMTLEECAELTMAILHFKRGKATRDDVISEIADVENMLGQIAYMLDADREEIDRIRIEKVNRCIRKHNLDIDV